MEYELGIKLDKIEQMLAYLIDELQKSKAGGDINAETQNKGTLKKGQR